MVHTSSDVRRAQIEEFRSDSLRVVWAEAQHYLNQLDDERIEQLRPSVFNLGRHGWRIEFRFEEQSEEKQEHVG